MARRTKTTEMKFNRKTALLMAVLAVPLLAVAPVPDFWINQLNTIGLYSLTCLGLVLLTGIGGLTSFGQAAFVGIGAYTTAWLTLNAGISPWITLFIGLAITAVSALVIGLITLRMSGHYLPLATIAWGLSLYYLMSNIDALGKYDGLLGIRSLSLFGLDVGTGRGFFVLTWVLVLTLAIALLHLLDSRAGRAIRALKTGSQMAEAMGISTLRYKVTIFVIAALFASASGWLFAHFQRTVAPSAFGLKMGIEYLFMTVVGGVGYVWGALVGAGLTKLLDDQLQVLLPKLIGTSGSYEVIVFGITLVLILKYLPNGLWEFAERRLPSCQRAVDWTDAPALPEKSKPAAGDLVLDVQGIRKEFGGLMAVNDISFQITAGEIVGLIGPNGAGKSTTIHLITNVLALTAGSVRLSRRVMSGVTAPRRRQHSHASNVQTVR